MLKMVFLAYRRAGMDAEEFQRYWREIHAPIASKIPGLRKYVQNHSTRAPDGTNPPYDGVAEMWFEDATSFDTPEFEATVADAANFLDPDRSQGFGVDELEIV